MQHKKITVMASECNERGHPEIARTYGAPMTNKRYVLRMTTLFLI